MATYTVLEQEQVGNYVAPQVLFHAIVDYELMHNKAERNIEYLRSFAAFSRRSRRKRLLALQGDLRSSG